MGIENIVAGMLREPTGTNFLDSGGYPKYEDGCYVGSSGGYGRNWEENQCRDFEEEDACEVEVWDDGVSTYYNLYHFLVNFLEADEESERLNEEFHSFAQSPEWEKEYWLARMAGWLDSHLEDEWERLKVANSCNWDNLLSQVIQYQLFSPQPSRDLLYSSELYILLQVHGGCDVRGGYTKPRVLRVLDGSYFYIAMSNVNACCDCSRWSSDDCGYHWYGSGCPSPEPSWVFDEKVVCENCGGEVHFHVMEGF